MESYQNVSLFPTKPQRDPKATGRQVKLFSNYYQLEFDQKEIQGVNKYTVKFDPEIPENSRPLRKAVLKKVKDKAREKLEFYIDWGTNLYSLRKVGDLPPFEAEHDGTKYKVMIEWVQLMEATDKDHLNFLKIFFNSMMRSLRFEQIGPKVFNPAKAHSLDAHSVRVWPGFDTRMIMKERGALLSIDVAFRVVRTDTVLDYITKLRDLADQKGKDWQQAINEAILNSTVVTK
jgi:aubergine-like protein